MHVRPSHVLYTFLNSALGVLLRPCPTVSPRRPNRTFVPLYCTPPSQRPGRSYPRLTANAQLHHITPSPRRPRLSYANNSHHAPCINRASPRLSPAACTYIITGAPSCSPPISRLRTTSLHSTHVDRTFPIPDIRC
ncbi:uncharacterized protein CC84DRAFT_793412 [Paraphaeosphaeria sporulosa]|uniref:REJ domain-containing protein n=1 Tax=Paraphaeosphaeria sporulosa TaxID=1460663 RepID=A0A177CA61_9PLEO|nr:uncharacterized protein CC84DRAFT_793412 [Paraphaeosphaeria sporulosa]OAG04465.1 hypothetical protein CC84DRAFT_793412 [Paraphaeosphaeria sporulosa]